MKTGLKFAAAAVFLLFLTVAAPAQTNTASGFAPIQISLGSGSAAPDVDMGVKILLSLTLLSIAPSLLLLMTCFTRIVIVLSFVRSALQLQGAPANQIII